MVVDLCHGVLRCCRVVKAPPRKRNKVLVPIRVVVFPRGSRQRLQRFDFLYSGTQTHNSYTNAEILLILFDQHSSARIHNSTYYCPTVSAIMI